MNLFCYTAIRSPSPVHGTLNINLVWTFFAILLTGVGNLTLGSLGLAQEPTNSHASQNIARPAASVPGGVAMGREQADAILAELRAIRELLQKQANQDRVLLVPSDPPNSDANRDIVQLGTAGHWHYLGQENAPVTLVEFSDYECPYCRVFHTEAFPKIKEEYIDTGKMRFISLDLPLPQHPEARRAAQAARCAGDQGKYWEMRDGLLAAQSSPSQDAIFSQARLLFLDAEKFRNCLNSNSHNSELEGDLADATFLQINGTPTFVLGRIKEGTLTGALLRGVMPYSALKTKIDQILASQTAE
jgi:protein-disulfide isomerase